MKVLILLVAGLYGCSFAGSWMRTHTDVVQGSVLGTVSTLRDLHELERQQQRDYIAWLEGRTTEAVVRADDARIAEYRSRLVAVMR